MGGSKIESLKHGGRGKVVTINKVVFFSDFGFICVSIKKGHDPVFDAILTQS